MQTAAFVVAGLLLLLASLSRLHSYRAHGHPTETGYLALAAGTVGAAMVINAPAVCMALDEHVLHRANLGSLLSYLLLTIGGWAALEMVLSLVRSPSHRRYAARLTVLCVLDVAMIIGFSFAHATIETSSFFEHYGRQTCLRAVFWSIFASLALELIIIAVITLRYNNHDLRWLRHGLRCVGIGAAAATTFVVLKAADLVVAVPSELNEAAAAIVVCATILIGTGALLPQLGPRAERSVARYQLRPMWQRLTEPYPYVRAGDDRPSLYRTVIEIQDAIAEARAHRELSDPLTVAVSGLQLQPADQFEQAVARLVAVSRSCGSLPSAPMDDSDPVPAATAPLGLNIHRLARVITEVTSPTVLAPALLVVVSIHLAITQDVAALFWGAIAAVFVGVLPLLFLLYGTRRGRWDDHHVRQREARVVPLAFAMACVAIGLVLLWVGSAPQPLRALVTAMLAGLAVVLAISRVWKVSIHAAVAGGAALVAADEFSWVGLGVGVGVLLGACWARAASGDHSTAQVIAGAIAGAAVAAAVYLPLR